jgi:DNA-binding transcriptional regulator YiaG
MKNHLADHSTTTPTAEQYEQGRSAFERHRQKAQTLPRFHTTAAQITANQTASHTTLRELRKSLQLTQQAVAEEMGMSQSELSRVERRDDIFLSTLERYVAATGGRLNITVEYDDRPPVTLGLHTFTNNQPHLTSRT